VYRIIHYITMLENSNIKVLNFFNEEFEKKYKKNYYNIYY